MEMNIDAAERYRVGDVVVDARLRSVTRGGKRLKLSRLSFNLLLTLVRAAGNVVSSETLLATVWKGRVVGPETVTQRVKLVRKALGDDSHHPRFIGVAWGEGYRVCVPVERIDDSDSVKSASTGFGWYRNSRIELAVAIFFVALLVSVLRLDLFVDQNKAGDGFAPPAASIAILPFINVGDAAEEEFFSFGLPDTLLNKLANLDDIIVVSRTSSFSFHNRNVDARTIGRSLNVHYLLEGSVQRTDGDVRIIAQLINTFDASHVWSFERRLRMRDIFSVQDELVVEIANALEISLKDDDKERLLAHGTDSVPAYLTYLRAKYASNSKALELQHEALQRYEEAIDLDPNFARAWLGVAYTYYRLAEHGVIGEYDSRVQMEKFVERALEIDPEIGQAYVLRAMMLTADDLPGEGSDLVGDRNRLLKKAVDLSPNDPVVLFAYSSYLCSSAPKDEACLWTKVDALHKAIRRDPDNPAPYLALARTYIDLNQSDMPVRYLTESVRRNPDFIPGYQNIALWHWGSHDIDWSRSVACLCEALERDPNNSYVRSMLSSLYVDLGMETSAENFLYSIADSNEPLLAMRTYSRIKLHLFRKEIPEAAELARDYLPRGNAGSWLTIALGAIHIDALDSSDFDTAIAVLESSLDQYNTTVEYEDGYIRSRSAALIAVTLSELHHAAGRFSRANQLIGWANEYFERENDAGSIWRPANAAAYAIVLQRMDRVAESLKELEQVSESYLMNSWFIGRSPAYELLQETEQFRSIVANIDKRISEQRSEVEGHGNSPPPCVPENHGPQVLLAWQRAR